jgi:D-amino peptidase
MRVYISADLEGVAGVVFPDQTDKGKPEWEVARRQLTREVNAAIAGAFEGGATQVIAADMHNGSGNFVRETLDPRARYVDGVPHGPRFPFLDKSIGCMFLIAYHAMAATPGAVLSHTMTGAWASFGINGKPTGEVGIDAAIAGEVSVPVALVTGDDKVCREARRLLGPIPTAVVKWAAGRNRAMSLSNEVACEVIRRAARAALARVPTLRPLRFKSPLEITVRHTELKDVQGVKCHGKTVRRVDDYTIAYRCASVSEYFGGLWKPAR